MRVRADVIFYKLMVTLFFAHAMIPTAKAEWQSSSTSQYARLYTVVAKTNLQLGFVCTKGKTAVSLRNNRTGLYETDWTLNGQPVQMYNQMGMEQSMLRQITMGLLARGNGVVLQHKGKEYSISAAGFADAFIGVADECKLS
jgi:hypothetical protein